MPLAIEMKGITKYFSSTDVQANDEVNFSVEAGEIHALVGENGAGKTTLMNILYGLYKPDRGEIFVNGNRVTIHHPDEAIKNGIGMVHQHFKLVPSFSVAQNILLGIEPNTVGFVNTKNENREISELAQKYNLPVDPTSRIRDLPVGMQQRVEILKVLKRDAKILILDEPTAVLTPQEVDELITVVKKLSSMGYTVVFITHKLVEVMKVADRVTVMRGGKNVGTKLVSQTSIPELARMMVGREVLLRVKKNPQKLGEVIFEADDISVADVNGVAAVSHVSFNVCSGEIVGIAGVNGNGQTELIDVITGMNWPEHGVMKLNGEYICDTNKPSLVTEGKLISFSSFSAWRRRNLNVKCRRSAGMAHIPEDRIKVGLNLKTNLDENLIVSRYSQSEFSRAGFLLIKTIREFAARVVSLFSIAAAKPGEDISMLSGGNLQKVVVGRELSGNPSFIVANQPTRGLDVGSIEFVHNTLLKARDSGAAILLVSVELDEIMSLSDRILVLYRGRIQGELDAASAKEEEIGILMAGGQIKDLAEKEPASTAESEMAL